MKILQRYIIKTILQAISAVIVLVACLEVFILFVNELHDIGEGNYKLLNAFIFSFMQLPFLVYQFFPLASLIGSLIGLGLLSSHSELTVMRASGLSISKIAISVLLAGLVIITCVTLMGEIIAPRLLIYSNQSKAMATSGGQALPVAQGLWLRYKNNFIHIEQITNNGKLFGIRSYQLDENQQLIQSLYAKEADYSDKKWWLLNVDLTEINSKEVAVIHHDRFFWDMALSPTLLRMSSTDPNQMSIKYLYRYVLARHQNYGEVNKYLLTFWSRIFQPLATCVMMLIAIPLVIGSSRLLNMNARIVLGVLLGFGFYLLNQFFGPVSLVFQMPPLLAAALPTLIFALGGVWMVRTAK